METELSHEALPLPWSEMIGMRTAHPRIFDLNLGIVHRPVVEALPAMIEVLRSHLDR